MKTGACYIIWQLSVMTMQTLAIDQIIVARRLNRSIAFRLVAYPDMHIVFFPNFLFLVGLPV